MVMVKTLTIFPPCLAVTIMVTTSAMSATTAVGGVARRVIAPTLTPMVWGTTASIPGYTTIKMSGSVFVAYKTEGEARP